MTVAPRAAPRERVITVMEGEEDALVTGSELVAGIETLVASFGARV